jgi:uncharacterized protein (DUF1330 family)
MSCYFIAQLSINDEDEYQKYLNGFDTIFKKFDGKVITVEENPIVLEGDWDYSRLVIIRFTNEYEAKRWYHSPEYQSLLQHRLNASKGTVLLTNDRSEMGE